MGNDESMGTDVKQLEPNNTTTGRSLNLSPPMQEICWLRNVSPTPYRRGPLALSCRTEAEERVARCTLEWHTYFSIHLGNKHRQWLIFLDWSCCVGNGTVDVKN